MMNDMIIHYSFAKTYFGSVLVASTERGVCYLGFVMKDEKMALKELRARFVKATFINKRDNFQKDALQAIKTGDASSVALGLMGTPFQLSVWRALMRIPSGVCTTYGKLATQIKKPKAVRAVGTAIGKNPIAILIPCHRVVPTSGGIGNYHWGVERKQKLIERERSLC